MAAAAGPSAFEGWDGLIPDAPLDVATAAERYRPERVTRPRPRPRLQPPLMPLIDVTFMLLLFFITTMQFSPPEGQILAQLPAGSAAAASADAAAAMVPLEPLRVYLRAGAAGGVDIEVERYAGAIGSFGALQKVLASLRTSFDSPDVPVVILPATGVSWQHALDALRQAQLAGFRDIAFAYKGASQ
jgi:biopolymer transport protein ExbD